MSDYDQKPKRKRAGDVNPTNYLIGGIVIGVLFTALGAAGFAFFFMGNSSDVAIAAPSPVIPVVQAVPTATWIPTVPPYTAEAQAIQVEPTLVANRVISAQVSPDKQRMVTIVQEGATYAVYLAPYLDNGSLLGERTTLYRGDNVLSKAIFDPSSDRLVLSALTGEALIFDVSANGGLVATLDPFYDAVFNSDGTLLALAGVTSDVQIIDADTLETRATMPIDSQVSGLAFTAGNELLVAHDDVVEMWLPSLEQVKANYAANSDIYGMALHPDGEWLALGVNNGVTVINITNQERVEYPLDVLYTNNVAFNADGSWLAASGGFSGVPTSLVFAWRWNQSNIIPPDPNYYETTNFAALDHLVQDMAFVNDDLLIASWDGTVRLLDVESGQEISRLDL